MSLRDRLNRRKNGGTAQLPAGPEAEPSAAPAVVDDVPPPAAPAPRQAAAAAEPAEAELSALDQLKVTLHRRLVDRLDLNALEQISDERERVAQIRQVVLEFLRNESTPLSQAERDEVVEEIIYEVTGLGPIEPLFRDPTITDILVNGAREVYVERRGRLTRVNTAFRDDQHLLAVIDRIVSRVGRRVDESSPMVDARLPDGSRVNAIIPPLALDGPVLSIRRFETDIGVRELIAGGAVTTGIAAALAGCVRAHLNILISGGTGAGKSTLLNALSSFIQADERIITIEDAAELKLRQEHVVRLETRPANVEGRGEVVARDLVRNALRMRPNRIIIGEVRGVEALDMLQAMNTGHEGSMTTIHANSPRDALARLETMLLMAGTNLPQRAMREQIASAIDLIVQVERLSDGTRRVVHVTEVVGMEGDVVTTSDVFVFRRRGIAPSGRVLGRFEPTGVRPRFADRLARARAELQRWDQLAAQVVGGGGPDAPAAAAAEPAAVASAPAAASAPSSGDRMLQQRLSAAESAARAAAQERDAARAQAKRSATALLAFVESLDDT